MGSAFSSTQRYHLTDGKLVTGAGENNFEKAVTTYVDTVSSAHKKIIEAGEHLKDLLDGSSTKTFGGASDVDEWASSVVPGGGETVSGGAKDVVMDAFDKYGATFGGATDDNIDTLSKEFGLFASSMEQNHVQIVAVIKDVLERMEFLSSALDKVHTELKTSTGRRSENLVEFANALSSELRKQRSVFNNLLDTTLKPFDNEVVELMRTSEEFNDIIDGLKKNLNVDDDAWGDYAARMMQGLPSAASLTKRAENISKKLGITLQELKTSKFVDLLPKIRKELMKGNGDEVDKELQKTINDVERVMFGLKHQSTVGGAVGGLPSVEKRIERQTKGRNTILEIFRKESKHLFKKMLNGVYELSQKIGTTVPLSDDLAQFIQTFDMLSAVDKPGLDMALTAVSTEMGAPEQRKQFLSYLDHTILALAPLKSGSGGAGFDAIEGNLVALRKLIDQYTDRFNVANTDSIKYRYDISETYGGAGYMDDEEQEFWGGNHNGNDSSSNEDETVFGGDESSNVFSGQLSIKNVSGMMKHFYQVAKMRDNLKKVTGEMAAYNKKYEKVLGEAMSYEIEKITEDLDKEIKDIDKIDDETKWEALFKANKVVVWNKDERKKETVKKLLRKLTDAKIGLYRALQAIDLKLAKFSDAVAMNPDDVADVSKLMDSVELIADWFDDATGNHIVGLYEYFPQFLAESGAADQGKFVFSPLSESDNKGGDIRIIDAESSQLLLAVNSLGESEHYYELVKKAEERKGSSKMVIDVEKANPYDPKTMNGHPGDPFMPISPKRALQALKYSEDVMNRFLPLRNLMTAFSSVASRIGGKDVGSDVMMSDANILKALRCYIASSAFVVSKYDMDKYNQLVSVHPPPGSGPHKDPTEKICYATTMSNIVNQETTINFNKSDDLMIHGLKAIVAKVFTATGIHNMLNFRTQQSHVMSTPRFVIGGYAGPPEIIDDAIELYIRLPLLAEFYKEVFDADNESNMLGSSTYLVSMIPEMDPLWSGLMAVVWNQPRNSNGLITENYASSVITEINKIYAHYKSKGINSKVGMISSVVDDIVADVNRRYGVMVRSELDQYKTDKNSRGANWNQNTGSMLEDLQTLDEESGTSYSVVPSDAYMKGSSLKGSDSRETNKWNEEFVKVVHDFRKKIEGLITNVIRGGNDRNKITGARRHNLPNFHDQVRRTLRNLKVAKTPDERYKQVFAVMSGVDAVANISNESYIMFHETVVAPLAVLSDITESLDDFVTTVWHNCAAHLYERMIYADKNGKDFGTDFDNLKGKFAGKLSSAKHPDDVRGSFKKGSGKKIGDDVSTKLHYEKFFKNLVQLLLAHSTELGDLVTINTSGPKLVIDHSKLQNHMENTLEFVSRSIDKFRGTIDPNIIGYFQGTGEGCLGRIKHKLSKEIFSGKSRLQESVNEITDSFLLFGNQPFRSFDKKPFADGGVSMDAPLSELVYYYPSTMTSSSMSGIDPLVKRAKPESVWYKTTPIPKATPEHKKLIVVRDAKKYAMDYASNKGVIFNDGMDKAVDFVLETLDFIQDGKSILNEILGGAVQSIIDGGKKTSHYTAAVVGIAFAMESSRAETKVGKRIDEVKTAARDAANKLLTESSELIIPYVAEVVASVVVKVLQDSEITADDATSIGATLGSIAYTVHFLDNDELSTNFKGYSGTFIELVKKSLDENVYDSVESAMLTTMQNFVEHKNPSLAVLYAYVAGSIVLDLVEEKKLDIEEAFAISEKVVESLKKFTTLNGDNYLRSFGVSIGRILASKGKEEISSDLIVRGMFKAESKMFIDYQLFNDSVENIDVYFRILSNPVPEVIRVMTENGKTHEETIMQVIDGVVHAVYASYAVSKDINAAENDVIIPKTEEYMEIIDAAVDKAKDAGVLGDNTPTIVGLAAAAAATKNPASAKQSASDAADKVIATAEGVVDKLKPQLPELVVENSALIEYYAIIGKLKNSTLIDEIIGVAVYSIDRLVNFKLDNLSDETYEEYVSVVFDTALQLANKYGKSTLEFKNFDAFASVVNQMHIGALTRDPPLDAINMNSLLRVAIKFMRLEMLTEGIDFTKIVTDVWVKEVIDDYVRGLAYGGRYRATTYGGKVSNTGEPPTHQFFSPLDSQMKAVSTKNDVLGILFKSGKQYGDEKRGYETSRFAGRFSIYLQNGQGGGYRGDRPVRRGLNTNGTVNKASQFSDTGEGLMMRFNEVLARYLEQFWDGTRNKFYAPLIESFANGVANKVVSQGRGWPDLVAPQLDVRLDTDLYTKSYPKFISFDSITDDSKPDFHSVIKRGVGYLVATYIMQSNESHLDPIRGSKSKNLMNIIERVDNNYKLYAYRACVRVRNELIERGNLSMGMPKETAIMDICAVFDQVLYKEKRYHENRVWANEAGNKDKYENRNLGNISNENKHTVLNKVKKIVDPIVSALSQVLTRFRGIIIHSMNTKMNILENKKSSTTSKSFYDTPAFAKAIVQSIVMTITDRSVFKKWHMPDFTETEDVLRCGIDHVGNTHNLFDPTYGSQFKNNIPEFNKVIGDMVKIFTKANEITKSEHIDQFTKSAPEIALLHGRMRFGNPSEIVLASLGKCMRSMLSETAKNGQPRFIVSNLSDIAYMKDNFKANLPGFIKQFGMINQSANILKKVVRLDLPIQRYSYGLAQNAGAMGPEKDVHGELFGWGFGFDGKPLDFQEFSVEYYNTILDKITSHCGAIINCATKVLDEMSDNPLFMEVSEDSLSHYRTANNMQPFTPLSSALMTLNMLDPGNYGCTPRDPSIGLPLHAPGGREFEFNYGTRLILGKPNTLPLLEHMPGVREISEKYNTVANPEHRIESAELSEFVAQYVPLIRWASDRRVFSPLVGGYAPVCESDNSRCEANKSLFSRVNGVDAVLALTTSSDKSGSEGRIARLFKGTDGGGDRVISRQDARIYNIIELNVNPININALRRDIPLINVLNYSYTFDSNCKDLLGDFTLPNIDPTYKRISLDDVRHNAKAYLALLKDPYAYTVLAGTNADNNRVILATAYTDSGYKNLIGTDKFVLSQILGKLLFMTNGAYTMDDTSGDVDFEVYNEKQARRFKKLDGTMSGELNIGGPVKDPANRNKFLDKLGHKRFQTKFIRNLLFIVSAHRMMNAKMNEEVYKHPLPIRKGLPPPADVNNTPWQW